MLGKVKGVAKRVREVAPHALYVHCYGHRLNLALQDTLQDNVCIRNELGIIQTLHNFFNTPKKEGILSDVIVPDRFSESGSAMIKLRPQAEIHWTCRWEAIKAVDQQSVRMLLALTVLSEDKDSKTSTDALGLLKAMLDFEFSLGLQVLKVIFSNTNALSRYLQGQEVDVMSAKTTCDATVLTLEKCRSDESFNLVLFTTSTPYEAHVSEINDDDLPTSSIS